MSGWLEGICDTEPTSLQLAQDECRVNLEEARRWLLATTPDAPDAGLARENFMNAVARMEEWGAIGRDGMWV